MYAKEFESLEIWQLSIELYKKLATVFMPKIFIITAFKIKSCEPCSLSLIILPKGSSDPIPMNFADFSVFQNDPVVKCVA